MRIAIKFAYDGRFFNGYARQPNLKTVEGDIINSLKEKGFIKNVKEAFFISASRTDKGVSALGNVVAFNTDFPKDNLVNYLKIENSSIIIYGIKEVGSDFYPRYAKLRQYRYYLSSKNLDINKIISSSDCFTGKHNFSNFAKMESFKNPVRSIDNIIFKIESDRITIDFFAQTFLWHQIRKIVSALIKIGKGKIEQKQIIKALKSPEKKFDFGLAPAENLILKDIFYDFIFEYIKDYFSKVKKLEKHILNNNIFEAPRKTRL